MRLSDPTRLSLLDCCIPGQAVSLNNAYVNSPRGRHKSAAARDFQRHVQRHLTRPPWLPASDQPLCLIVHFYADWLTPKGRPRRSDLSNLIKLLEDAIFTAIGIDDCCVFEVRAVKRHTLAAPHMHVRLEALS